jgi:4'-phosphopantetheinyl transferase
MTEPGSTPPLRLASPSDGEVHVWTASLDEAAADLDRIALRLTPVEHVARARYHRAVDRDMFALSRGVRRSLLGAYLAHAPETLDFLENAYGKPRLASGHDVRFNVSHSGRIVLVAVTRARELGVDLEAHREDTDFRALATHVFSPSEQEALFALPEPRARRAFFTCWSRKEAVIKALGLGLSFPLDAFDVSVDPSAPPRLLASRDARLDVHRWSMHEVAVPPGYASALVVEAGGATVRSFTWTPRLL